MPSPSKPIARWSGSVAPATNITSASISVNAGDLLVLCVSAETYWTGAEKNLTMAISGGGTWTTDKDQDNGAEGGHASIHHLVCPSTTSFTIGVQYVSGTGPYRLSAQVYKFAAGDFDSATPIGATGGGTGTTSPLNPTLYTSTVNNSRAVYCGAEYALAGTVSSSDTYDAATYAGVVSVLSAYKDADTATSGTAVAGNLVAAASCYWTWAAVEVKPSATASASGSAAPRGGGRSAAVGAKGMAQAASSRGGGRSAAAGSGAAAITGSAASRGGGRSAAVGAKGVSSSAAPRAGGRSAAAGSVGELLSKPIARWSGSVAAATDITSASISVNAGDLLVLCVSAETFWTGAEKDLTMAVSGGGTWTTDKDQDNGAEGGHASIHHLVCPSTTSFTIGVQYLTGIGGPYQLSAQVYKFAAGSFDAATPIGATGGGTGTTSPLNPTLYTSTVNNSRAVYCGAEYFINGAVSSSDPYDSAVYTGSIAAISAYKEAVTPTAGTAVAGNLVAAASCYWTWAAAEVRPAGAPTGATGTASSRDGGLLAASGAKSVSRSAATSFGSRTAAAGVSSGTITGSAASRGGARTAETSFAGLGSIDVGWDAVSGAAGYRVKWGLSSGVYTSGSIDVPSLQLQCVVGHLTPGVTYYLTCVALDSGGVEGDTATELSGTPDLIQAERDPCVVKCGGRTQAVGAKSKSSAVASRAGARSAATGSGSVSPVGVAASRGGGRSSAVGAKGVVSSVSPRDGGKLAAVGAKGVSSSVAAAGGGRSAVTGSSSAAPAGIAASRGGSWSAAAGAKGGVGAAALRDGGRSAAVGINSTAPIGFVSLRGGGRSAAVGVKSVSSSVAAAGGGRSAAVGARVATGSAGCRGGGRMSASLGYIPYVMPLAAARRTWDNRQYVSRPRNVQS